LGIWPKNIIVLFVLIFIYFILYFWHSLYHTSKTTDTTFEIFHGSYKRSEIYEDMYVSWQLYVFYSGILLLNINLQNSDNSLKAKVIVFSWNKRYSLRLSNMHDLFLNSTSNQSTKKHWWMASTVLIWTPLI